MTAIDAGGIRTNPMPGNYPVNLRFTVPFMPKSFFVTLIIGNERRGRERLREERTRHPISTWGNLITVATFMVMINVAVLFTALVAASV